MFLRGYERKKREIRSDVAAGVGAWLHMWAEGVHRAEDYVCTHLEQRLSLSLSLTQIQPTPLLAMAPVKKVTKKSNQKFEVNVSTPAADGIFDVAAYETFLHDRIKVEGRTNNLTTMIKITREGNEKVIITVHHSVQFSKRYIKYLTKKFLKKHMLRDWIRVVASNKSTYELRYFNINDDNEEEEEEDEEEAPVAEPIATDAE